MGAINERFATVRQLLGMNQTQYGVELGISQRDVWRYETGETGKIPYDVFKMLYDKCGVNLNWLIAGVGEWKHVEGMGDEIFNEVKETMPVYAAKKQKAQKPTDDLQNELILTLKEHNAYLQRQNDMLMSAMIGKNGDGGG
ncbi:MAG: helix-turn-helix transcriptional regulator [Marinilabiliaceae bacterium]|nr:helix-turn-helix transcriptional regulator [Marinilabiliaceae bacterium]